MGFPRQEYWSRLRFPSPGIFLTQGSNVDLLHQQVDSLPLSHLESPSSRHASHIFPSSLSPTSNDNFLSVVSPECPPIHPFIYFLLLLPSLGPQDPVSYRFSEKFYVLAKMFVQVFLQDVTKIRMNFLASPIVGFLPVYHSDQLLVHFRNQTNSKRWGSANKSGTAMARVSSEQPENFLLSEA